MIGDSGSYLSQIATIALLAGTATCLMVRFAVPPGPWHLGWMVALPLAVGMVRNPAATRWWRAPLLVIVAVVVTAIVGTLLGGV